VLRGYAEKFHARPATWTFLTGPQDAVENAIVKGFKIAVGREKDDTVDGFTIVHGTMFVLVDAKRQIRGYYESDDAEAQSALRRDLSNLAEGND
jgi:protein SCO1/2